MQTQRIFLVGMMGAGKTTLGRQLAERLGYTFVDLDDYLEQRESKTIPELFAEGGEDFFRERERQALEAVVQVYEQAVIATGGGTPCFFDNIHFINQNGISVYLKTSPETLTLRLLQTDLSQRPLLAKKTEQELKDFISKTLAERSQFYHQATHTVDGKRYNIERLESLVKP